MADFVYVESPNTYTPHQGQRSLFLAGAIPGDTADWQNYVTRSVAASGQPVAVFNPRRRDFPADDPGAVAGQVAWEHEHLHAADATLFWFPAMDAEVSVAPTTLFELGMALGEGRPLVVGASPWYPRRDILEHQLSHHPGVVLHLSLDDTVAAALRLLSAPTHLDGEQP